VNMPRRPSGPGISKGRIILIVVVAMLFAVFASARFYTDVLWFQELNIESVLWKSLRTQLFVGLIVGISTAVIVWVNLAIASRLAPAYVASPIDERRVDPLVQLRSAIGPFLFWLRLAVALFIGFLAGIAGSTAWQTVLLWANKTSFGKADPQFGRDISFYVFELPFLDLLSSWVWFAFIAALFTSAGVHYFHGAIQPEKGIRGVSSGALAHLSVLLGALALVKSFQYYLGTFELNFSERGTVTGASYTDVNAQLPALRLLAIISILSALLFIVNIFVRRLSLPLAAVGIWILTAVLAGGVWPLVVQRFSVEPQEPQRERPYIQRNLDATRTAFGLEGVESLEYPGTPTLTGEQITANEAVLQNVRLWDPGVLERAYAQLQAIRTYYQFTDVDIDRYEIDGEMRQVLLSARELQLDDLPDRSKTWQNVHLQYTHGFGLVASLANESTTNGQPSFLVRDVPGTTIPGAETLETDQPRIYYGESFDANEYSIVNSEQEELDYALEDSGVERSNYAGTGGIELGNIFQRLAFAVREGDPNLILSGLINPDSRILIYRNVRDRVRRAAPFLDLDDDPYVAVVDDRLVWIVDAYTSTTNYPYAQRFDVDAVVGAESSGTLSGSVNYVRNSVKVVVDAYDGTMDLHIVDEEDPMIQTWRKVFPSLFTADEPSAELREHFRYPEDLFTLQSEVYRTYHMTDPLDFYSKEDEWDVPTAVSVGSVATAGGTERLEPTYLLFRLPGETDQEFVLTQPFTPRRRPNMIAQLVARSNPDSYGEVLAIEFPRSRQVPGPQQVENLINQDVEISQTLTLLDTEGGGSNVEFGSLVILPLEESILYVQPMFVTAENVGIPELKKVVVVQGEQAVMADTFEEALADLFDLDAEPVEPTPSASPGGPDEPDPGDEPAPKIQELIDEASDIYERAQAALADGDFATYARLIERLGGVLDELSAAR
jgi:uncharacterized membrane protein (UPF0182 family)